MSSNKKKLPNKILIIPSKEKKWHEKWYNNRDYLDFPHPFRIVIASSVNCGKTNLVKNILLRCSPPFKKIYLYHYDIDCEEYDDIDIIKLEKLPNAKSDMFKKNIKSILIIEDCKILKSQLDNLDRLFGYTSTHKGLSIIIISQNFYSLPPIIRRMSNIFAVWKKSSDFESLYAIGRKFNLDKKTFKEILNHCKSNFDFILFDQTPHIPYSIRYNAYTPLTKYEF